MILRKYPKCTSILLFVFLFGFLLHGYAGAEVTKKKAAEDYLEFSAHLAGILQGLFDTSSELMQIHDDLLKIIKEIRNYYRVIDQSVDMEAASILIAAKALEMPLRNSHFIGLYLSNLTKVKEGEERGYLESIAYDTDFSIVTVDKVILLLEDAKKTIRIEHALDLINKARVQLLVSSTFLKLAKEIPKSLDKYTTFLEQKER